MIKNSDSGFDQLMGLVARTSVQSRQTYVEEISRSQQALSHDPWTSATPERAALTQAWQTDASEAQEPVQDDSNALSPVCCPCRRRQRTCPEGKTQTKGNSAS